MPKIYLHYPEHAFSDEALTSLADELTTISLECENLPNTPFVRSTVWIYANEYPTQRIFVGGAPSGPRVISLEVNVFEGGLEDAAKGTLIERFTESVARHACMHAGKRRLVYVLIKESKASNWGIFGERITLDALRHPPADALPIE